MANDLEYYLGQSPFTDPGAWKGRLDGVASDLVSVRNAARELIHYFWLGDGLDEYGIAPQRLTEIDLRFSEAIFGRAFELVDAPLTTPRSPAQRVVGCCRDSAVTLVSIARHRGIPARVRTGFASYLSDGLMLDHVIGEVWDSGEQRWRRVDAQLPEGYLDPTDGTVLRSLDVPTDRFISSAQAWLAARAGEVDADEFIVSPDLDTPGTKGWQFLVHNLLTELAALNKREMLCWDAWGLFDEAADGLSSARQLELDELAQVMLDRNAPVARLASLYARPGYRVPGTFMSFSHTSATPRRVDLRDRID